MRIFKQLQKVGRLAPRQPVALQRGDTRALALYVPLGLQNVPFCHLDVVSECHQPLTVTAGREFRRAGAILNAGLDWSLPQL